jgi:hypothetical protein
MNVYVLYPPNYVKIYCPVIKLRRSKNPDKNPGLISFRQHPGLEEFYIPVLVSGYLSILEGRKT